MVKSNQAPMSENIESAIDPRIFPWDTLVIQTGKVSQCSNEVRVNSPNESVIARNSEAFTALRIAGKITSRIVSVNDAPKLREASTNVFSGIEESPTLSD